jgi:hypothetical protein
MSRGIDVGGIGSIAGGNVAKKAQGPADKGGTLGEIAESLGTLLGNAERQWKAWQGPRDAVLKAVTDVRDRASALLAEMGADVRKGYDQSKAGKKNKKAGKKAKADKADKQAKKDAKKAGKKKDKTGKKAKAAASPAEPLE